MGKFPEKNLQEVVDFLNNLNESDPETIKEYLSTHIPISERTAKEHPYIQCSKTNEIKSKYSVRLVGFLNGMFECDEYRLGVELNFTNISMGADSKEREKEYQKGYFQVNKFRIISKEELLKNE